MTIDSTIEPATDPTKLYPKYQVGLFNEIMFMTFNNKIKIKHGEVVITPLDPFIAGGGGIIIIGDD